MTYDAAGTCRPRSPLPRPATPRRAPKPGHRLTPTTPTANLLAQTTGYGTQRHRPPATAMTRTAIRPLSSPPTATSPALRHANHPRHGSWSPPAIRRRPPTRPHTATTRPANWCRLPARRPAPRPAALPPRCTYDPAGNSSRRPIPNGITTTCTYNSAGLRPATSATPGHPPTRSATAMTPNGNRHGDDRRHRHVQLRLDPFGELTSATNGAGQTVGYSYDADGQTPPPSPTRCPPPRPGPPATPSATATTTPTS